MFLLPLLREHVNRQTLATIRNLLRRILQKLGNFFLFFTMSQSSSGNEDKQTPRSAQEGPPPFDPTQPSIPVSYPIKTLEELESRSYFKSFHYPFNKARVRLHSGPLPNRRRMLVCHDMAGGYNDDKWAQGGTNPDAYAIWHWYLIDIFVYFSHSLVSLPPPCWINAAHQHGVKVLIRKKCSFIVASELVLLPVNLLFSSIAYMKNRLSSEFDLIDLLDIVNRISKVLGTFITEWDEGRAICNALLSTKESSQLYAERLTELAVALGFDGWLINMEVALDLGQIPNMEEFVSHLTQTMHSSVPGSLVIWYDSVTVDGKLSWQDQLNEKNKAFFDSCDGIFVNYTWKEGYPKLSAAVAGDRKFDVYMGIDVFGRNTFGGGQWKTNDALDRLRKDDVSASIFAPGWVYESKQPPDFQTANNRWWDLVKKSWGISRSYPQVLPFHSNFDQGHGYHVSIDGVQVSDSPWFNISCQGFQPLIDFNDDSASDSIQPLVNFKEASYSGGGSITFKGTLGNSYYKAKLFQGELLLGDSPLHFSYSVRSEENSLLGLSLGFSSSATNETKSILFTPEETNQFPNEFSNVIKTRPRKFFGNSPKWVLQEGSISMNGNILTDIHAVCYISNPSIIARDYFSVLGSITLKSLSEDSDFPHYTSWLVEVSYIKWTSGSEGSKILSLKISWRLKDGIEPDQFPNCYYYIYVKKQSKKLSRRMGKIEEEAEEYVGVAYVEAFYLSDLLVPSGISELQFVIQVCRPDGSRQKLEECPVFQLDVNG